MTNLVNESHLFLWVKLQLRLIRERHENRLCMLSPLHKHEWLRNKCDQNTTKWLLCNSRDGTVCIKVGHLKFCIHRFIHSAMIPGCRPEDLKRMVDCRSLCILRSLVEFHLLHFFMFLWFAASPLPFLTMNLFRLFQEITCSRLFTE